MKPQSHNREPYEVAFRFFRAWVDGTLSQARRYRAALEQLSRLCKQSEYIDDGSPASYEVMSAADAVVVEAHLLVNAAHQLQKWGEVVTERDNECRPASIKLLSTVRNSTEHLDKAILTPDQARGTKEGAWSIEQLPGKRLALSIRLGEESPLVFDMISVDDIERSCHLWSEVVLDYLEPDLDRVADEQIDNARGK